MKKYRLTLNHLEQHGNIKKLERDGFTREDIHRTLYNETEGASNKVREKIIQKLYDRSKDGV